jgi:hypothetical protein
VFESLGADRSIPPIPFETLLAPFLTRITFQRTPHLRARILRSSILPHSEHVCFNDDQIAPERAIDRRVPMTRFLRAWNLRVMRKTGQED